MATSTQNVKSGGVGAKGKALLAQHRADLDRSGLTEAAIRAAGLYSETSPDRVARLLGWQRPATQLGPCQVFPYLDRDGNPTGYHRLKPDKPRDSGGKYEAPPGLGNRLYIPPGVGPALADPSRLLVVVEGEKKSLAGAQAGFACVAVSGVWNWTKRRDGDGPRELIEDLAAVEWWGRRVVIVFDSDGASNPKVLQARHALAEALAARQAGVRVVDLPPGPGGEKVGLDDYLVAHGADAFRELLAKAVPPSPSPSAEPPLPEPSPWPDPLAPEAFHGPAGELVRLLEPASEADPAALLVQTLVAFGSMVGRAAYFVAESDRHHPNEFVVLVGRTSKARKGSSWGRIECALAPLDEEWTKRVQTGLSSGEGVTWWCRDRMTKRKRVGRRNEPPRFEDVEEDPGVSDKRLLAVEPEFANVLQVIERQGNVLSATLRLAWDGKTLQTLAKNAGAKATGAHVSIVGHITVEELRRYLSTTQAASGYGNRHLFLCAKRSKSLPEGGQVDGRALVALRGRFAEALAFARKRGELRREEGARCVWREVYDELSEGRPGMAGALLSRAEAHVMRLALICALLDRSAEIRQEHLLAALAVWTYAEQSVRHVFGDGLGDPVADEILALLRASPAGRSRTEIRDHFQRNAYAHRVGAALTLLLSHGLARREQRQTGGRPAEWWFATAGRGGQTFGR
jgi:hypothetical protein